MGSFEYTPIIILKMRHPQTVTRSILSMFMMIILTKKLSHQITSCPDRYVIIKQGLTAARDMAKQ